MRMKLRKVNCCMEFAYWFFFYNHMQLSSLCFKQYAVNKKWVWFHTLFNNNAKTTKRNSINKKNATEVWRQLCCKQALNECKTVELHKITFIFKKQWLRSVSCLLVQKYIKQRHFKTVVQMNQNLLFFIINI